MPFSSATKVVVLELKLRALGTDITGDITISAPLADITKVIRAIIKDMNGGLSDKQ